MERNERRIRHNYDNPLILALVIKLDAVNIGKVPKFLEDTFGASIIYQKTAPANHRLYIREEGRDRYEH